LQRWTLGGWTLRFSFDADGRIVRAEHTTAREAAQTVDAIPADVHSLVNNALANGTPLVLAYVNAAGEPVQTIRGSVQIYSPTEACAWLRHADGDTVTSIHANPHVSFMYRDSRTRSTISFEGVARFTRTPDERDRVYELAPETEQMHVPDRSGIGLVLDVKRMLAFVPTGTFRMNRQA
jgi:YD repeat-containing protein